MAIFGAFLQFYSFFTTFLQNFEWLSNMFYGYIWQFFNDLSNKFLQNLCKISKSIQNIIIYLYCIYLYCIYYIYYIIFYNNKKKILNFVKKY